MGMAMRNLVKDLVDKRGDSPYRFWKDTGLSRATAYRLYNDPTYIPTGDVLEKVCRAYSVQPGDLLRYVPDEALASK